MVIGVLLHANAASAAPAVAAGYTHVLLLLPDGTVRAWGQGGGLGDGIGGNTAIPVTVVKTKAPGVPPSTPFEPLTGVTAIAAGNAFSLALLADGSVWAWGANTHNVLGVTGGARPSASPVPGLSDVTAIAAGEYHALALKSDGTVWAWGRNINGQLGNGTTTAPATPEPAQVTSLGNNVISNVLRQESCVGPN